MFSVYNETLEEGPRKFNLKFLVTLNKHFSTRGFPFVFSTINKLLCINYPYVHISPFKINYRYTLHIEQGGPLASDWQQEKYELNIPFSKMKIY